MFAKAVLLRMGEARETIDGGFGEAGGGGRPKIVPGSQLEAGRSACAIETGARDVIYRAAEGR
jgi:hypothetical protein